MTALVQQTIIFEELARASAPRLVLHFVSIHHAAATILGAGTLEQQARHMPAILDGEIWCQGFSEPDAGSDLASLSTRAVRDGDVYVVNRGQRRAHHLDRGRPAVVAGGHRGWHTVHNAANVVVGATGYLSVPRVPSIPGADTFEGESFHSTAWPSVDCTTGRRVAVIGSGASANQIVPALAGSASEVVAYQRTPHWITGHPYYGRSLAGVERWLMDNIPSYQSWFRFRQFGVVGDRNLPLMRVDPEWPHPERSVNQANDKLRLVMTKYIEEQTQSKPELLAKVLPTYPPYAKRLVVDNGYRALCRDDVLLITDPIERITPKGIETANGLEPVDVIVYATGFQTNRILWPVEVVGFGGADIRQRLDNAPEAYLGYAFEDCPNLFVTTGPNGIPVHGGAGTFVAESQAAYIGEVLRHMFESDVRRIEINPKALRKFVDETSKKNAQYVWSTDGVDNWFKGTVGSTSLVLPLTNLAVWQEGQDPDMSVYLTSS